jgi:hypothetical protein
MLKAGDGVPFFEVTETSTDRRGTCRGSLCPSGSRRADRVAALHPAAVPRVSGRSPLIRLGHRSPVTFSRPVTLSQMGHSLVRGRST